MKIQSLSKRFFSSFLFLNNKLLPKGRSQDNISPDGCRKAGITHSELSELKILLMLWADIRGKILTHNFSFHF